MEFNNFGETAFGYLATIMSAIVRPSQTFREKRDTTIWQGVAYYILGLLIMFLMVTLTIISISTANGSAIPSISSLVVINLIAAVMWFIASMAFIIISTIFVKILSFDKNVSNYLGSLGIMISSYTLLIGFVLMIMLVTKIAFIDLFLLYPAYMFYALLKETRDMSTLKAAITTVVLFIIAGVILLIIIAIPVAVLMAVTESGASNATASGLQ